MRASSTFGALALWVHLSGCGYQSVLSGPDGRPRLLRVPPVREGVVDLDVGAMVQRSLRLAAGRVPGLVLATADAPVPALEAEVVAVHSGLSPFAEPNLRAASYRVVVEIRGRLVGLDGRVLFTSAVVRGQAPFYSTAGRIEVLDGAARRALEQACERAAEGLVMTVAEVLRVYSGVGVRIDRNVGLWDRITSQFIEIIEFLDDGHDTLVWRFPVRGQEIKNGAKLIVREGQQACFVNEGKLADVFGPGTYTLSTRNLPILATLRGWKYGFDSPFKAEVYFVGTTQVTDLKWGTQNPIMVRDPELGPIRLRAFGLFTLRVADPARVLRSVAGTDGDFEVDEIIGQLRRTLVSRFTQALGKAQVPALDLAANYDEVAARVKPLITADFEDMGLEIPKFVIENISLPPAVEKVLDARSEMAILGNMSRYAAYRMAHAIPDAARTPNSMAGAGMGMAAGMQLGNQMAGMMTGQPPGVVPGQMAGGFGMAVPGPQGAVVGGMVAPTPVSSPQTAGPEDTVARMKKLDALKAAGVLSEAEYTKKRQEILAEI